MKKKEEKKNKRDYFEYYAKYFLKQSKIKNKESTYSCYYYVINSKILPYFKDKKVKSINDNTILNYTNKLIRDGLSNKTIKDTLTILYAILKKVNSKIEVIYPKISKNNIKVLKKEEQLRLEEYLITNLNNVTFGIYLSLYTGLRIGEVCSLKWNDIDTLQNKIIIRNTISRVKLENSYHKTKLVINDAKSKSSIREIPLSPNIKLIISKINNRKSDNYVLSGCKKYIDPRTFYNKYKTILNELNIENYTFHTLRHTFATRCIDSGADPKTLSLILGHSSVKITLDRYVHPDYSRKVKLMNSIDFLYKF